jgi:disulfide bond formation protein DsbB
MKASRSVFLAVGIIPLALIAYALYLQHVQGMQPCPLCVIQRYAFLAVSLIGFIFAALPHGATRAGASLGVLAALSGTGVAAWHLWVKAHPTISCGIDPLETSLNRIPTAELMPFVFKADGLCATEYAPILGLSIPQWSLIWFVILALILLRMALRRVT